MQRSQANRAVIAARITPTPARVRPVRLAQNGVKGAIGPVRNRKAPRMTSTQRDSTGRVSDWSRSPYAPRGGWR